MLVRAVLLNASEPIEVTVLGIVTLERASQPLNTASLMDVIELGIITLFRPLNWNASEPIEVTELGMSMLDRLKQSSYLQLIVCQLVLIKTIEK